MVNLGVRNSQYTLQVRNVGDESTSEEIRFRADFVPAGGGETLFVTPVGPVPPGFIAISNSAAPISYLYGSANGFALAPGVVATWAFQASWLAQTPGSFSVTATVESAGETDVANNTATLTTQVVLAP